MDDYKTVVLRNLPDDMTEASMRQLLLSQGFNVREIQFHGQNSLLQDCPSDQDGSGDTNGKPSATNQPFCLVRFGSKQDQQRAVEMLHHKVIGDKIIDVNVLAFDDSENFEERNKSG